MRIVRKCLKDDGLFLLRTIGGNHSVTATDPWIARYIFPNGMLPSPSQIGAAIEGVFVLEKWDTFGPDYDKTLMHWFRNFHEHWHLLKISTAKGSTACGNTIFSHVPGPSAQG